MRSRAPPADLEADREGAVGIERERYRGLADLAALAALAEDETVASSWRMITVMVCAESPVWRAISALGRLPWRRISDSTRRSL